LRSPIMAGLNNCDFDGFVGLMGQGQYLGKPCLNLAGAGYAPLPEAKQILG
jgi:hypothetical protein